MIKMVSIDEKNGAGGGEQRLTMGERYSSCV